MIRFVGRLFTFAVVFWVVMKLLSSTVPPNELEISFLRGMPLKHKLLEVTREPSLVLLGGSGTAFGFDSAQISEQSDQPIINAGLHAGLGIRFMIEDIQPRLMPGDHLVCSFEYELWTDTTVGSTALAAVVSDIDPGAAEHLAWWQRLRMTDDWLTYVGRKTTAWTGAEINRLLGREIVHSGAEIYRGDGFNRYGDLTTHWGRESIPFPAMKPIPADHVQRALIRWVMIRFEEMARRGIRCTLMPPVLEERSYRNQAPLIDAISAELREAGIPYSSPPENYRYELSLFFDTPYHLNRNGIEKRGANFYQDLGQDL